jgi:hypothetical protein
MALVSLGSRTPGSRWQAALAGALWGLAALVRPVVLILPGLVAALPLSRQGHTWRSSLRLASGLALGMALVVGPYMLRNLAVSGRFIPVSAQAGFALWASSAAKPAPGEAYVAWVRLWREEGMPIYQRVTGSSHYSITELTAEAPRIDEEFRRVAMANIRRDPRTYVFNVANNLRRFHLDTSEWWWRRFLWENNGRAGEGDKAAPLPPRAERAILVADGFLAAVSLAGLAGLALGLARRDPWAAPLAAVYAALCLGNAVSFTISRYTYARLPVLILSLGFLLRVPRGSPVAPSTTPRRFAQGLIGALLALALWATFALLLARA